MSQLVRVDDQTHMALQKLARQNGKPMGLVLAEALRFYADHLFWEEANRAFAAANQDPSLAAEDEAERQLWESTLGDGLEEDPYPVGLDNLPLPPRSP
jgi:predicted transcriptional regulator